MLSLYDITVPNFLRSIEATIVVMQKGQEHLIENYANLDDIINMRLAEDMLPFSAQINIATHNAVAGIQSLINGEFRPPQTSLDGLDYTGLIDHLTATIDKLKAFNKDEVDARFGKPVYFKFSDQSVPFTAENFMMSFAIPNVYFHTTTVYDMLRIKGVPLGKREFLGKMQVGIPE